MLLFDRYRAVFGRSLLGVEVAEAERGELLLKQGLVLAAEETSPGIISGQVEAAQALAVVRPGSSGGDEPRIHDVTVKLSIAADHTRLSSQCTCGRRQFCAHAAAVLTAWVRDLDESEAKRPAVSNAAAVQRGAFANARTGSVRSAATTRTAGTARMSVAAPRGGPTAQRTTAGASARTASDTAPSGSVRQGTSRGPKPALGLVSSTSDAQADAARNTTPAAAMTASPRPRTAPRSTAARASRACAAATPSAVLWPGHAFVSQGSRDAAPDEAVNAEIIEQSSDGEPSDAARGQTQNRAADRARTQVTERAAAQTAETAATAVPTEAAHADGTSLRALSGNAEGAFERVRVLDWIRALPRPATAAAAAKPGVRVCHVLSFDDGEALLRTYRLRIEADGSLAQPEPLQWVREIANPGSSVFDSIERTVWPWLQRETLRDGAYTLNGTGVASALVALADSGRLYVDEAPRHVNGPALQSGEPRPASPQWRMADGQWRLDLVAEPAATLICADRPCYVDRTGGVLGPVRTTLDDATLRWLRTAPLVPEALIADAAAALQARRLSHAAVADRIPAIPELDVPERDVTPVPVVGLFASTAGESRTAGGESFVVISLAVEYDGRRVEPLRAAVLESRGDDGPELIRCDPQAERAAVDRLRAELTCIAEGATSFLAEGSDASGRGVRSGWLTMGALSAGGIPAARLAHVLLPTLKAQGWQVVDRRPEQKIEAPELLEAQGLYVEAEKTTPTDVAGTSSAMIAKGAGKTDAPRIDADPGGALATGSDWFSLQCGLMIGEHRADLAPILAEIVEAGSYEAWAARACPDGTLWLDLASQGVVRIDARRIEPLARTVADWGLAGAARFTRSVHSIAGAERALPPIDALALAQLARRMGREAKDDVIQVPASLQALRHTLDSFDGLETVAASPDFTATLRPYQQQGLDWLQWLARAGLGGILADDMGLGKTVQLLAHLDVERERGRLDRPALVISPTSLVFNWQAEATRHAPKLRVLDLTGPTRGSRFDSIPEHDLVLTSYALLARDADELAEHDWHMVALDEAQTIKNARTRAAAGARRLRARHRVALTGTPLENHLGELWSIMQFAVPGLLGSDDAFRQRFRSPIERMAGTPVASERLETLDRRIRPFMLRRTKDNVLTDLPPRTDMTLRVEMGPAQRDLYESIRAMMDERVRDALRTQPESQGRIVILDALLKLRQACCDPALVRLERAPQVQESAKLDALVELLVTLISEGRKALVFSQFTSMLDLIERALDANPQLAQITRSRLDGDTDDRAAEVHRFQSGPAQIFLLSLRAGGVGLNLTAADTVVHYDPWWNPAVERQATDRAHRMGQDKPVFVYRMITAGTVEERIAALQERKSALIESVLSGAMPAGHRLMPDDLLGLFDPI